MNFKNASTTFVAILAVVFASIIVSQGQDSTNQAVAWTPSSLSQIIATGGRTTMSVVLAANSTLGAATLEVVPELAAMVRVEPTLLNGMQSGQTQQVVLTFSAPTNIPPGTYAGTIHLRIGKRTIPQVLPVTVTVIARPIFVTVPTNFQLNTTVLSMNGPISMNNFSNAYDRGGLVPSGGADIDVTSVPLPKPPLKDRIDAELEGATITSSTSIAIGQDVGTEVFYTDDFGDPQTTFKNVAVYLPHGTTLYKFFLTYHSGDPSEAQFLSAFQQVLSSAQLPQ